LLVQNQNKPNQEIQRLTKHFKPTGQQSAMNCNVSGISVLDLCLAERKTR
jgi:hypothetical protein